MTDQILDMSKEVPTEFGISADFEMGLVAGAAKAVLKSIGSANDMFMVDPRHLKFRQGFNVRIKDADYWSKIDQLVKSIGEHGFYRDKPLAVFVAKEGDCSTPYVVEGHRRLDAALKYMETLSEEERESFRIPVVFKDREINELDMVYGLYQGNTGERFRPYELAVLVKRLRQVFGQSNDEILEKMPDISASYLNSLLIVAGAPRYIAEMIISDELSVTTAAQLMTKHGSEAVNVLKAARENAAGKRVTDRFLPGKKLEGVVKKGSMDLYNAAKTIIRDPGYANLSGETRQLLGELMAKLAEHDDEPLLDQPESVLDEDDCANYRVQA